MKSEPSLLVAASPSKPKSARYDASEATAAPPRPTWLKGAPDESISKWTAKQNRKHELKLDSKLFAKVEAAELADVKQEESSFDAFRVDSKKWESGSSAAGPSRLQGQTAPNDQIQDQKRRDEEALTIIENLEPGPKKLRAGEWKTAEPNSGIRLKSRILSHEQVQANLEARYFLTPSVLYSIIRLARNRQHYDVPVDGDWVTIAVVCGVKNSTTKGKESRNEEDDDDDDDDEDSKEKKKKPSESGPRGKVFYNGTQVSNKPMENHGRAKSFASIKLCALPPRQDGKLVGAGGDALLNMLLFSADGETKDHQTSAIKYRGGSGGAYEKHWKLTVGTVIGIISPKVLKPYGGKGQPDPMRSPLGITPNSEEDIFVIGQAKDLAYCTAKKKDGERCQNWVDTRENKVCEFHLSGAIERTRGSRGEFAGSTSSMRQRSTTGGGDSWSAPRSRFGLKPSGPSNIVRDFQNDAGGQMYVVGGKTFSSEGAKRKLDSLFLAENMGRGQSQKISRRRAAAALEQEIQDLANRDRERSTAGGKYVLAALAQASSSASDTPIVAAERVKGPFHAEAIRKMGFDPRQLPNNQALDPKRERDRLALISSLRTNQHEPKLGPMPGPRNLSSVVAPSSTERFIDLNDDDE